MEQGPDTKQSIADTKQRIADRKAKFEAVSQRIQELIQAERSKPKAEQDQKQIQRYLIINELFEKECDHINHLDGLLQGLKSLTLTDDEHYLADEIKLLKNLLPKYETLFNHMLEDPDPTAWATDVTQLQSLLLNLIHQGQYINSVGLTDTTPSNLQFKNYVYKDLGLTTQGIAEYASRIMQRVMRQKTLLEEIVKNGGDSDYQAALETLSQQTHLINNIKAVQDEANKASSLLGARKLDQSMLVSQVDQLVRNIIDRQLTADQVNPILNPLLDNPAFRDAFNKSLDTRMQEHSKRIFSSHGNLQALEQMERTTQEKRRILETQLAANESDTSVQPQIDACKKMEHEIRAKINEQKRQAKSTPEFRAATQAYNILDQLQKEAKKHAPNPTIRSTSPSAADAASTSPPGSSVSSPRTARSVSISPPTSPDHSPGASPATTPRGGSRISSVFHRTRGGTLRRSQSASDMSKQQVQHSRGQSMDSLSPQQIDRSSKEKEDDKKKKGPSRGSSPGK